MHIYLFMHNFATQTLSIVLGIYGEAGNYHTIGYTISCGAGWHM